MSSVGSSLDGEVRANKVISTVCVSRCHSKTVKDDSQAFRAVGFMQQLSDHCH